MAVVLFSFSFATAGAYAVSSSPSGGQTSFTSPTDLSQSFSQLTTPFEDFFNSLGSLWTSNAGGTVPSYMAPTSSAFFTNTAQNAFQSFDNWLYGIAGFHISGLFVAILNIFSWILGILQNSVTWLLSVFK